MDEFIFGRNAVTEAILAGKQLGAVYVQRGAHGLEKVNRLAHDAKIPVKTVDKPKLDLMLKDNSGGASHHSGVAASVPASEYVDLDEVLPDIDGNNSDNSLIIMLDGVEDPHNLGAVLRSADAAGASAVIIPKRRGVGLTAAAYAASAGAAAWVKVCREENLTDAARRLKERGYWLYGADMNGSDYTKTDFSGKVCLVLGAEGRGISRLLLENCDFRISIPMKGRINSLNVSVAAGILMFDITNKLFGGVKHG